MTIISYSKKETHNLGNYESVSVEISIEDEPEGDESKTECYERLKQWVDEKLDAQFRSQTIKPRIAANNDYRNNLIFEELKHRISVLVKKDRTNQDKIRTLLSSFGASKLSELSEENINKVNTAICAGKY